MKLRALSGRSFPLYGDGSAVRDFTFVGDAVTANLAAADRDVEPGTVVNVAGGSSIAMRDLLELAGDVVGAPVEVESLPNQPGDVARTGGTIDRAQRLLGWEPLTDLRAGLTAQADWHRARRA